MSRVNDQVREFHRKFGLTVNTKPTMVGEDELKLRCSLILEEALEFCEAAGFLTFIHANKDVELVKVKDPNMVGMADAVADLNYVNEGAAVTLGLDTDALGDEVHRSNMTKVWEDGTVHRREDGKVVKPPIYSPADITAVLQKMENGETKPPVDPKSIVRFKARYFHDPSLDVSEGWALLAELPHQVDLYLGMHADLNSARLTAAAIAGLVGIDVEIVTVTE